MGNRTPIPLVEGFATLEVNPTPSFLVLEGRDQTVGTRPRIRRARRNAQRNRLAVDLRNPFAKPIAVTYAWKAPNTLTVGDAGNA